MEEAIFTVDPVLDKKTILTVEGWQENLCIEYSTAIHAGISYLCWKIKDTEQLFRIQATIVYEKHSLKFSDHFSLTLKTFREDYLSWKEKGFTEDWMKRYYKIFNHLIK